MEPGVPGTLGIKIGASIDPVWISKSAPALGMFLSVSSDKGVYAEIRLPKRLSSANAARRIRGIVLLVIVILKKAAAPYPMISNPARSWRGGRRAIALGGAKG